MMKCKSVTVLLFTVLVPPLKPNLTAIALPEIPLQTYLTIRQPPISVTHNRNIIPPSQLFNFLRIHMANIISRSSSDCDI